MLTHKFTTKGLSLLACALGMQFHPFFIGYTAATPESRAAALFLLLSPSNRVNGMGKAGVALTDEIGGYYNPAAPAVSAREHLVRLFYQTPYKHLPWWADDMSYSRKAVQFNWNSATLSRTRRGKSYTLLPPSISAAFSVQQTKLNLGEQTRTDERGTPQGTFGLYEKAEAYVFSIGYHNLIDLGLGLSLKRITSNPGGGLRTKGVGKTTAYDFGIIGKVPIDDLVILLSKEFFSIEREGNPSSDSNSESESVDVVYLKDGGVRKGLVIEQVPNESLKLQTLYGEIYVIDMKDISRIAKERKQSTVSTIARTTANGRLRPLLDLSAGVAWNNRGPDIVFIDASQADPLPANRNLGWAITAGVEWQDKEWRLPVVKLTYSAQTYIPQVGGESYPADTNDKMSGYEISLAETFDFRRGKYDDNDGERHIDSDGFTVRTDGLFNILLGHPRKRLAEQNMLNRLMSHLSVSWTRSNETWKNSTRDNGKDVAEVEFRF